jgi:hypothetical protein
VWRATAAGRESESEAHPQEHHQGAGTAKFSRAAPPANSRCARRGGGGAAKRGGRCAGARPSGARFALSPYLSTASTQQRSEAKELPLGHSGCEKSIISHARSSHRRPAAAASRCCRCRRAAGPAPAAGVDRDGICVRLRCTAALPGRRSSDGRLIADALLSLRTAGCEGRRAAARAGGEKGSSSPAPL